MKEDGKSSLFELRTRGLLTSRDAWNYNSSRAVLDGNVSQMIEHYNGQETAFRLGNSTSTGSLKERAELARSMADLDATKFSWDRGNFLDIARGVRYSDVDRLSTIASYRPFHLRWA